MSKKEDISEEDLLIYLVFGAAVAYFLYKNNVFGVPAAQAAVPGTQTTQNVMLPSASLPPSSAAAASAPAYGGTDFGSTTANPSWDS